MANQSQRAGGMPISGDSRSDGESASGQPRSADMDQRDGMDRQPRIERIARRAYDLYEARGGDGGRDLQDWLDAEREIDDQNDEDSFRNE